LLDVKAIDEFLLYVFNEWEEEDNTAAK